MVSNEWKLPLNLAIGFHVLVLLSSIYLPGIFKAKPKFADIYTVSIINVAEPVTAPPPPPPKIAESNSVVKKTVKPVTAKKVAPIAEPQPVKNVVPEKAVSLKPLKKKVVKKVVQPRVENTPKVRQKPKTDNLAKQRRQELADAIREEELLTERARLAQEAVEIEKNLLQTRRPTTPIVSSQSTSTSSNSNSSKMSSSSSSQIERLYYAAITNRLLQFWALPESVQKKADLMSTAVITINKNGQIADIIVEQRSGDRVFDQFVSRTIRSANPMPAIPAAMKKQRVEIGLKFKPGGIQ
ncbi:MAG: colicin import membrane protein [Desulforhopalus sp.]|jgi:colicin import membrane protein